MVRMQKNNVVSIKQCLDIVIVDVDSIDLVIHVDFHNQIVEKHIESHLVQRI